MKNIFFITSILLSALQCYCQSFATVFENTAGAQTATYFECIKYYENLDRNFNSILVKKIGATDAGYPLHLVLFSSDNNFDINKWQKEKVIILVNNGIHAGEPDGIDASMMLARDLAKGKVKAPKNVVIAFIAVYNIGGVLNRNSFSRVNQQGPESYGFRGNAQNLDLNRDFTKSDSRNARAFATIFNYLKPTIFIDNHVSDGADYQHTMTLLTTQHNKLGGPVGDYLHLTFEPALYAGMQKKGWPMCPYVNFEDADPEKGWAAFYDPPRYSSGYASLFQTIAFVPETHMLKPYRQRVQSTYALMQTIIEESSKQAKELLQAKRAGEKNVLQQTRFALSWLVDSSRYDTIHFEGYTAVYKTSEVTGLPRLYYDHSKPFEKNVIFYDYFKEANIVTAPDAYIIPQGWHEVIDILKLNNISMKQFRKDTAIEVKSYRIEDYKSYAKPYEKHHKNYNVAVSSKIERMTFLKGDYVIYTNQIARRYLIEMLEPTGDDSFFSWNFFDAVLQQKEGYSDYRWEDVAAEYLKQHAEVRQQLEEKKKTDSVFANSSDAQLDFVYKRSHYYEPAHMRYPVYRIEPATSKGAFISNH